jgi:hypothetical protein
MPDLENRGSFRTRASRSLDGAVLVAAFLIALVAVLAHLLAAGLRCGETSGCARSTDKDGYYAGTLIDERSGRVVSDALVPVYFSSIEKVAGRIHTDGRGRFCVRWAEESVYPDAHLGGRSLNMRVDWQSSSDAEPAGCESLKAEIPWDRARGLAGRWPAIVIPIFVIAGGILVVVALVTRRRAVRLAAISTCAAAAAAWLVVWT